MATRLTRFVAIKLCSRNASSSKSASNKIKNKQQLEKFNVENESLYGPLLPKPKKTGESSKTITPDIVIPSEKFFPLAVDKANTEDLNCLAKEILFNCDKNAKVPSVTTILQRTMSDENAAVLENWRIEMIKKLGKEGFAEYTKETFATGHAFHKNIHDFLSGTPESQLNIEKNIEGHWKSISSFFPKISDVVTLETKLTHPYLNYVGIIDCIAKIQDKTVLIEWKTSQKPKPTLKHTYDNPIQLAAYIGAWNFNPDSLQVDNGIIVISYPDGKTCHVHDMNHKTCHQAWKSWLTRLSEYYQFENAKISAGFQNV
uniref:Mitochondrial genome maintenance exonuclease 1 n=1 Tax=Strigamia maritima TaxID=126957 RepID=T1JCQ7_STRMM